MILFRRHLATAALAAFATGAGWLFRERRMPAPQVRFSLLDGSTLTTGQLMGQVVLVNFWATNCSSCVAEMPAISATNDKFQDRAYQTLAVAMRYDPPARVADFAESRRLGFKVAIDNTGEIARSFGQVELTPTSFLIDKHGAIAKRWVGAPDFAALHREIEQLLSET